jgi:hypothetical protein
MRVEGEAATPRDALLAVESGLADRVAGRAEHLLELVQVEPALLDRVEALVPRQRRAGAVLALPVAAWVAVRRRPGWAVAGVAVAGVAVAAVLLAPDEPRRPDASPVLPSAAPSSSPGASPPPRSAAPPRSAGPSGSPVSATADRPAGFREQSPTRQPPRTSGPSTRPPVSPSTSPTGSPSPSPAETPSPDRECIVRLDLLLVDVQICRDRPNVTIRVLP